ncbi:MAG: Na+/H+ antiporter NhaC family protein [Gemmatimonadetes bacterium]|nr:Na+/H+ antiporter NhaC family protein [Gemmatimonadota bacterium]
MSLCKGFATPIVLLLALAIPASGQQLGDRAKVVLGGVPFSMTVEGADSQSTLVEVRDQAGNLLGSGAVAAGDSRTFTGLLVTSRDQLPLQVRMGDVVETVSIPYAPGWFSLMPPLLAIALALLFKEVVTALLAGIWLGALAVAGYNPVQATWRLIDQYVVPSLGDTANGKTQIVVFSLMLGGMVGMIARNGGTLGVVKAVTPFARSRRRGKIATWLAGLAIFFDDYANTLIVGNTLRPITDSLKISREKLAYIVDSTAAPVAALVPISTWVGYEISLIAQGLGAAAGEATTAADAALLTDMSAFGVFLQTIPYLFYPILALFFVFLTSSMNRDLGPMAAAEERAGEGGGLYRPGAVLATDTSDSFLDPPEGTPHQWWNAGIPVLTVIFVVLGGLYTTGRASAGPDASLMDVFGAADAFSTLLWGSLAGCVVAGVLSVVQRLMTVRACVEAWVAGVRAMLLAMVILTLAWSLGSVTVDVGTAGYLSQLLSGRLPIILLPALVFVTSGAMAFATGTSWATMAIMIPLVIPLSVSLMGGTGLADGSQMPIFLGVVASVLAGAIWGDHCSPISDTTVLSSTAAGCDHVDHVKTQLPYAFLVGAVGLVLGSLGTAMGLPAWLALLGGAAILVLVLRTFGRAIAEEA